MQIPLNKERIFFHEACLDDLRVSGHQLPMPPGVNGSSWGQVTTMEGLTQGCHPPSNCLNTTCEPPLSCYPSWTRASCSCGPGRHLIQGTCEDTDECLFQPCLHGSTCQNLDPDYMCICGPNHLGKHCQWTKVGPGTHPLTAPVAITAVTLSLLILILLGVFFSVRHHRLRSTRAQSRPDTEDNGSKSPIIYTKQDKRNPVLALDPGKKEEFLGISDITEATGTPSEHIASSDTPQNSSFLHLLKLSKAKTAKERKGKMASNSDVEVAVITTTDLTQSQAMGSTLTTPLEPCQPHHQLPSEDLRNYAYEGDGSSAGSLTSTLSGLRAEMEREESSDKTIVPEFLEVMDLLKNLPEAPKSSALLASLREKTTLQRGTIEPGINNATLSLGSLRRREQNKIFDVSSAHAPASSSSGNLQRDLKNIEMPSTSSLTSSLKSVSEKEEPLTTSC
ncbi:hypothetical protein SK128_016926 [Halocaridina rubra]|uniref:EGF-like domain-containing protein n=1 Tax=Halocaridina rubra TaxID=373956 RepID=A0AAN9A478_HALRR